jgi:hypothetical protein
MSLFEKIAEQKIREAQEQGEFDNLPGAGKPLPQEDDSSVPEDLRLAYKILKNASCLPPELEMHKEILRLQDLLATVADENERLRQMRRINFLITRLNTMRKRPIPLETAQLYGTRLAGKSSERD